MYCLTVGLDTFKALEIARSPKLASLRRIISRIFCIGFLRIGIGLSSVRLDKTEENTNFLEMFGEKLSGEKITRGSFHPE
jgi:hypothetical protein